MNWKKPENEELVKAFLALKNADEAQRFLRDLLTEDEIKEFAKRLQTAEMLLAGASYVDIQKKTGFSSTTVARVSRWLNRGKNGYKTIINKLHHHSSRQGRKGLS
ncbi:MAG: YerC/YecD family TrpR-related protein [Candidatus Vogelbacteria bacterium]|nr:YerC/YecD family TrpR-related protein [Candidatus Vogelbacteria bacterium]